MDMDILEKFKPLWSYWEVRVLILFSLSFQIILLVLGRLRKTSTSLLIQKFLWIIYILADLLTYYVLTQQSRGMNDSSSNNAIFAFWAPFLILHLGGPDTITAYSLEDNELWARHLLSLIYALMVAIYVLFCSFPNTLLLAPSILIFLVAIIKCGERLCSMYRASARRFYFSSLLSFLLLLPFLRRDNLDVYEGVLMLYYASKPYFIDAIPDHTIREGIIKFINKRTIKESLTLTYMELSYVYDKLYTKANFNHSRVGYVLRGFCTICILVALLLFVMAPKNSIDKVDVVITYVLLTASVFLDAIAAIMLFSSNWMMLRKWCMCLTEQIDFLSKREMLKRSFALKEMPQLNIINNCLSQNKSAQQWMMNKIKICLSLLEEEKLYHDDIPIGYTLCTMKPVNATLEHLENIAIYAKECIQRSVRNLDEPARFFALHEVKPIHSWVVPSIVQLMEGFAFNQQVVIWHISTELCLNWKLEYLHPMHPHQAKGNRFEVRKEKSSKMEICEYLSNYMIYLVLMQPQEISNMERKSFNMFLHVYTEMCEFLRENGSHLMMMTTIENLEAHSIDFRIIRMLAHLILVLEDEERWDFVTKAWVELLILGAQNTKAIRHKKKLSSGVDLLTFIWLLSKYFGIDYYPIKTQHSSFMNSSPEDSEDRLIREKKAPHSPSMNMNSEDIDGIRKALFFANGNMSCEVWIKDALRFAVGKMSSEDINEIKYAIKAPHSPSMNMNSEYIDGIRKALRSAVMKTSSKDINEINITIKEPHSPSMNMNSENIDEIRDVRSAVMKMSSENIQVIKSAVLIEEFSTKIKSHLQDMRCSS